MSDDMITWLRAQLDEDETNLSAGLAEHLGSRPENDFRFRLAEVNAKRRILELYGAANDKQLHVDAWIVMKDVVKLLALAYAGRPGYREEWKP